MSANNSRLEPSSSNQGSCKEIPLTAVFSALEEETEMWAIPVGTLQHRTVKVKGQPQSLWQNHFFIQKDQPLKAKWILQNHRYYYYHTTPSKSQYSPYLLLCVPSALIVGCIIKKTGGILWSKTFQDQIIEQFYKNSAMKMILLDSQDAFLGL